MSDDGEGDDLKILFAQDWDILQHVSLLFVSAQSTRGESHRKARR